ncbi:DUF1993 family protein [Phenylobacterium sp.]|uniref:DUF1993 domain-containing protein n=1 Tax=Phenylobacterium sp. TaxID=1871053 RepID=UPI0025E6C2F4|nr:DUF1993 domain-containing protein [Phenylobacterium sp.]
MAISLYDVSVSSYLQTLNAVSGYLAKGLTWATEGGHALGDLVETRLHGDMLPFRFQIVSVCHHSRGAIAGAKSGVFSPPGASDADYAGLQAMVAAAIVELKALSPDEINALEGQDMAFQLGERKLPFVVKDFILSFSLPNFHFHATTGYDILRQKGVPLGKRDYLGAMRMKV